MNGLGSGTERECFFLLLSDSVKYVVYRVVIGRKYLVQHIRIDSGTSSASIMCSAAPSTGIYANTFGLFSKGTFKLNG